MKDILATFCPSDFFRAEIIMYTLFNLEKLPKLKNNNHIFAHRAMILVTVVYFFVRLETDLLRIYSERFSPDRKFCLVGFSIFWL
jgi:hypothetical protein